MSCSQLVTPNLDPIIYQQGHMLTDWYGYCLAYVQTAFNTGWAGSNATEAWTDHIPDSAKHLNREIPGGMYVPIYFSGYHGLGHFGIYKDGYVWCTPVTHKPTADVWDSISTVEQKYGVTYVGWTEMLGGTQVVEYTSDPVIEVAPPQPKYQVTETYPDGKQIQLNKQPTNLWGMNFDFDYMKDHPVETHNQGEIWTVTNKVHHQDGYDYYRREDQIDGFNVMDCDDYTPPPPPPPPAAPVTAPAAQRYTVKATIMYFGSSQDAQFKKNAVDTIPTGTYYIFDIGDSTVYLGRDNMHAAYWINTKDNVIPKPDPKPIQPVSVLLPSEVKVGTANDTVWKASYKQFYVDGRSDKYQALHQITFLDYDGKRGKDVIPKGQVLPIPGTFEKDGVTFYRPRSGKDEYFSWWYGIPMFDDYGNPNLVKVTSTLENIELGIRDLPRIWIQDIKQIFASKKGE